MAMTTQPFGELKRRIYLFTIPGVFTSTAISLALMNSKQELGYVFDLHIVLLIFFFYGWIIVYFRKSLKLFKYVTIILMFTYQIVMLSNEISTQVGHHGESSLSSFVLWIPMILMFIFIVLKRDIAFAVSLLFLGISIIPGIAAHEQLNTSFKESLIQLYLAMGIYSIMLFFAHSLFQAHTEIKVMRRQFYLDPLTQIGNRNQIDLWMEKSIEYASLDNGFSILFFDIDLFKSVNDQFGHVVGDDVLRTVAQIVEKELDETQLFGRWGGEEFIVILKMKECEAYQVAEKLRKTIETHEFDRVGRVTASFGVVGNRMGDTVNSMLVRGDKRLYISKNLGRNRVTGKTVEGNVE